MSSDDLLVFLGIILLSGYHSVPSERDIWSSQPDLSIPFVAQSIPRDKFLSLKNFIHLSDNQNLQVGNKVAKVQPLYDRLNNNLKKFGIPHKDLSIDESMVPYHGKHSAKMFIRMKPIRFGYKLWVLAGSDGYPYHTICYTGKRTTPSSEPLGFLVVNELLDTVKICSNPHAHAIYFDNFFTSYQLIRNLHDAGFRATGTIRQNRSGGANKELMTDKELKKLPRGTYDYQCDGFVYVVKWSDSAIVYFSE